MKSISKKIVAAIFVLAVLGTAIVLTWVALHADKVDYIGLATFNILALSLVVLTIYAYDTNAMAAATTERWQQEAAVYRCTYEILLEGNKGSAGRTVVRLHNPSTLVEQGLTAT